MYIVVQTTIYGKVPRILLVLEISQIQYNISWDGQFFFKGDDESATDQSLLRAKKRERKVLMSLLSSQNICSIFLEFLVTHLV